MKTLNKVKISIWINALSAIVIGILFLINPQESFQIITILAGIIITFTGIVDFIYYFMHPGSPDYFNSIQIFYHIFIVK